MAEQTKEAETGSRTARYSRTSLEGISMELPVFPVRTSSYLRHTNPLVYHTRRHLA
jgi:hypothetical protein